MKRRSPVGSAFGRKGDIPFSFYSREGMTIYHKIVFEKNHLWVDCYIFVDGKHGDNEKIVYIHAVGVACVS